MADFNTPKKATRSSKNDLEIVVPPSPYLTKLGYGTGVSVLKMVRSPLNGVMRSPLALKMVNKEIQNKRTCTKRLINKATILKQMSHPNVVGYRTLTNSGASRLCLGMELCDESLGDKIENRAKVGMDPFEPGTILKVALDVGKALDYIHTKVKILHGDLKSYNVLVNGEFEICKLCDFGVSLALDDNGIQKNKNECYYGAKHWNAPEVFTSVYPISDRTDMFSYGLVLWEMMSLMPPHFNCAEESLGNSIINLDDNENNEAFGAVRYEAFDIRPPIPHVIDGVKYCDPLALFYSVTEKIPQMRPSAHHMVLCVQDMLDKINVLIVYEQNLIDFGTP